MRGSRVAFCLRLPSWRGSYGITACTAANAPSRYPAAMPAEDADPETIARLLGELIAMLEEWEEERWVMAFKRVAEHVTVTVGAPDRLSTARVVRDLLHMFRGGLGTFAGLQLSQDGETDEDASARLLALWTELRNEVARQLGNEPPLPVID